MITNNDTRLKLSTKVLDSTNQFEQRALLKQSSLWSRAILWVLMGVTTTTVVWASVAKIEEAIPAQGKLEPVGAVKDVQASVDGVVKAIYVDDGQRVKQGDRLLSLEPSVDQAQLTSLQKIRTALTQENQFYRSQMSGLSAAVEQAKRNIFVLYRSLNIGHRDIVSLVSLCFLRGVQNIAQTFQR